MYQLVVFDWDGTIMDSAQKITACLQAAAHDVDLPVPNGQQASSLIGLGLREAMSILFPNADSATIDQLIESYKQHFISQNTTKQGLFENVEQGLVNLNEAGVLLAVATGKARPGLQRAFAEVGLEEQFVITRCADETRSKPHPQMLLEILDFAAIDPHKSIMVGDTTYDMDMANAAGVDALGVSYGVHSPQALRDAKAVDIVDSFNAVIEWLLDGRVTKAYD